MNTARFLTPERKAVLLLVEDNTADATLLTSLFKEQGYDAHFHWVRNGQDAVDFLFQRGNFSSAPRPDLVLLDLNLPRLNGREVLKSIRTNEDLSSVPVIVMTTSTNDADMMNCYELEVSGFLTKPKELKQFEALVKRIIGVDLPMAMRRSSR